MTEESAPQPRKRSLTQISLQWLAERLRKSEEIKQAIQSGSYRVDSQKVAASILVPRDNEK